MKSRGGRDRREESKESPGAEPSRHYTKSAKYALVNANFGQKSNVKQADVKPRVGDKSGRGPQVVPPHTVTDSPPTKRKKGVAEKASGKIPVPANFPGEIMGGAKKSLSSFKIPKRSKVETKAAPSPPSAAVKIPALDITEGKSAVGDVKMAGGAMGKMEAPKMEEKAKVTPVAGTVAGDTGGKKLSDLRLETATSNLRAILSGSDQNFPGQGAPALIQDLLSIAQNLPSKSSTQNISSKPTLPAISAAQNLPPKSITPSLPSKSTTAQSIPSSRSVATLQDKKAVPSSQAQSEVPAVVSAVTAVQAQAAATNPSAPLKPKPVPAKGGSRVAKPKKAKEPPKPSAQAAAKYVTLFQTLEPSILQSLAATIQQSLKVITVVN